MQSGRATRGLSLPREGAWIATEFLFSFPDEGATEWGEPTISSYENGARIPTRLASSHSNLNVTPRPTQRPRHERLQLRTLLPIPPPGREGRLDITVGAAGGRHGADPAELGAHSEHFSPSPSPKEEGQLDNTEGDASRTTITSSSDTMRPSANRHKTQSSHAPRRSEGLISP